jgi:hypothetical protein
VNWTKQKQTNHTAPEVTTKTISTDTLEPSPQ